MCSKTCYFDDRYVFDESGFHTTWAMRPDRALGGDYNGDGNLDWMDDHCGAPCILMMGLVTLQGLY